MKKGILFVAVLALVGTAYLRAQSRSASSPGADVRPVIAAAAPTVPFAGQALGQESSATTRRKLPAAVVGMDTPEKVTDDVAYRMFFSMLDHVTTRSKEHRATAYLTQVFTAAERARHGVDHAKCVKIEEARTHHGASTQKMLAFMRAHQKETSQVEAMRRKGNGRAYFDARGAWANRLRSALAAETSAAIARDVDWYVKNVVKKRTTIHIAPVTTTTF